MKTLKMVCTAVVLALTLSVPGWAGEISTPGFTDDGTNSGTAVPSASPVPVTPVPSDPVDAGLDAILITLAVLF